MDFTLLSGVRSRQRYRFIECLETRQLLSASVALDDPSIYDLQPDGSTSATVAHPAAVPPASVTTVLSTGPASNRIDIAVVGDGFLQSQLPTFTADVQTFISGFFDETPLSSYKSFFNVYQVNVISSVSGVSGDPTLATMRDTPLSMSFDTNGIDRLLGVDTVAAKAYAQNAPGADQVVAIANSSKYGGAGYPVDHVLTFAGGNASAVEIVKHEFGHSFAQLADEYDYGGPTTWTGGEPAEADVSTYTAAQMVANKTKWYRWIGVDGVGTYEGADYSQKGIYRPTLDSKMRTLGLPYGPVDSEQLIEKMYDTVQPIDSATAAGTYASSTGFSVKPLEPSDHADSVQWYVDGKAIAGATGLSFKPSGVSLTAGSHALSVKVEDMNSAVRDETFRSQHMTETKQWTITVGSPPADNIPPTAKYTAGSLSAGDAKYRFAVTFSDNIAVKASTIDSSDILVSGPSSYTQLATLITVNSSSNGTPRTATYQIKAPGGVWDTPDNGSYTIQLRASQVSDTAGHFAAATDLGTLKVAFSNTITVGGRVFVDHNGDGVQQSNDAALAGVPIYIDLNHNGVFDAKEPKTTTNSLGDYLFTTLGPGSFRVREVLPVGYLLDSPNTGYYDVTLVHGVQLSGRSFANAPQPLPSAPPVAQGESSTALEDWLHPERRRNRKSRRILYG